MRSHPFDALSFVAGAVFVLVGAAVTADWVPFLSIGGDGILPAVLIVIGVALLLTIKPREPRSTGDEDRSTEA